MARLDLLDAPEIGEAELRNWGRVLCVAPHPDDEALGCGGTLARLCSMEHDVGVVWVSDGAGSHPNSIEYAPPKLAQLREREAICAARELGVREENLFFLRLPDGALPFPQTTESGAWIEPWKSACQAAMSVLGTFRPDTLLLPWRRDPHRDHRATWHIWANAAPFMTFCNRLRRLEYLVWAFERAAQDEWPQSEEARALRVSIRGFERQKRAAIDAHASQTTRLIGDDAGGFWLSPEVIAHFETPFEAFIEPFDSRPEAGERALPHFQR